MNSSKSTVKVSGLSAGDKVVSIAGSSHYGNRTVDEARTYNKYMTRVWFTDGTSTGPLNPNLSVVIEG